MIKVFKFKWEELKGQEVIAIPAIGKYEDFVTEIFIKSQGFYDLEKQEYLSCEDRYIKMLNEGKVLFHKKHLIFMEGWHKDYYKYAIKYEKEMKERDLLLCNLKYPSDYGMVSNILKIVKDGLMSRDKAIKTLSKYFKNENYILSIV